MSKLRILPVVMVLLVQFGCGGPVCEEEMCLVPAGSFIMGCDADSTRSVCPPSHEVTLEAFMIDRTEVTYAAFMSCVDAGVCSHHMDDSTCRFRKQFLYFDGGEGGDTMGEEDVLGVAGTQYRQADMPMVCVTWVQAQQYCEWAGKRLPTEAEWEKAARGTDKRVYPWGNEPPSCDLALFCQNRQDNCGGIDPDKVCSRSPAGNSPYGLCDMAGNVREWVFDFHPYDKYNSTPVKRLISADVPKYRVVRGGGIWDVDVDVSTSVSYISETMQPLHSIGFRCAKSVVSE